MALFACESLKPVIAALRFSQVKCLVQTERPFAFNLFKGADLLAETGPIYFKKGVLLDHYDFCFDLYHLFPDAYDAW